MQAKFRSFLMILSVSVFAALLLGIARLALSPLQQDQYSKYFFDRIEKTGFADKAFAGFFYRDKNGEFVSQPLASETGWKIFFYMMQTQSGDLVLDATDSCLVIKSGQGLWGPIRAMAVWSKSGHRFSGLDFFEQKETPGLGARIAETAFTGQFLKSPGNGRFVLGAGSGSDIGIDALTGATLSSQKAVSLINDMAAVCLEFLAGVPK